MQNTINTTSKLGLGLAALGRPGYMNIGHGDDLRGATDVAAMRKHCHHILDHAYRQGVRYFDAARSYGRAEEFLADWLTVRKPEDAFVASKWGYTYTADWQVQAEKHEVKDHSLAAFQRQWPESEALLGNQLQLYQIHSATLETGVLDDESLHRELYTLKSKGVRIGLSLSSPRQSEVLTKALTLTVSGEKLFDAVQATYNLLEQNAADALARAHEAGLMVIVKEGLANGRLTSRNTMIARDRDAIAALNQLASETGNNSDSLALAFVLSRPFVDIVLSGAATEDQLESNLTSEQLRNEDRLVQALNTLARQTGQTGEVYWQVRSELPWH